MEELDILNEIKLLNIMILKKMHLGANTKLQHKPTPTQMQILDYILKHEEEEIYQKDLENIFHLSRATVSSVLQTMEKYGLIDRVVDTTDARTKKIILSPKAKQIFDKSKKKFDEIKKQIVKDIKKEDLVTFYNVLEKMKANISEED